jgi:hypothetical protein
MAVFILAFIFDSDPRSMADPRSAIDVAGLLLVTIAKFEMRSDCPSRRARDFDLLGF